MLSYSKVYFSLALQKHKINPCQDPCRKQIFEVESCQIRRTLEASWNSEQCNINVI